MKYKLLVLDLDGTLTNAKKEITPRNREALIRVQQQGVKRYLHRDVLPSALHPWPTNCA